MAKKKLHKEPLRGDVKGYMEHEARESDSVERKERDMNPKAEEERQKDMNGAHLEHTQIKSKHNKVMPELTNDLAYFLHHPQLAPEHKQFPTKAPKC
jgi:hypothetical protein